MAKVQILPEKVMPDPLDGAVPASYRRLYVADIAEQGSLEDDEASVKTDKVDFVVHFCFFSFAFSNVMISPNGNSGAHTVLHPFNGLFSRTTWLSQHQNGRTILDFTEARDDGMAMASARPYANHLHLAPDRSPCQYLTTQFLYAGCPSCCPTNSVKALKANNHM